MRPFFYTFHPPPSPFKVKVGSVGLLYEKVKQCPVLFYKKMKGYREIDVVNDAWNAEAKDLEFIENGASNLILFFKLYLE